MKLSSLGQAVGTSHIVYIKSGTHTVHKNSKAVAVS